jgi:DNA-binding transcriptional ArsR family regulator
MVASKYTALDESRMKSPRLANHPIRQQILRNINSHECASTLDDLWRDLSNELMTSYQNFSHHLRILVKYGIVYEQKNYMKGRGNIYSIYWSDQAQEVLRLAEGLS